MHAASRGRMTRPADGQWRYQQSAIDALLPLSKYIAGFATAARRLITRRVYRVSMRGGIVDQHLAAAGDSCRQRHRAMA